MKTTHWEKGGRCDAGYHFLYVGDLLTGFRVSEAFRIEDVEIEYWLGSEWAPAPPDGFFAISPYEDTKTLYATLSAAQEHCESMYQLYVELGIAELHLPYEGLPPGIPDEWFE